MREFAANFFRKRKIEVTAVSSGEEAIEVVETQKPDLVLLDIKMDGIDGVETLRRIRQKNNDIKVIMVTGRKLEEGGAFEECQKLGISGYIHKPLELDELEKIVLKESNS